MGRLNPQLTHFSHPHPLELTDILATNHHSICWGCRLSVFPGRPYCWCRTCGFCLHATCFHLPRKISHPCDPSHHLILAMSPSFHCKACGNPGGGLCFSCKECNHDYHSLCTLKPLLTTSPMHPHPLSLEFKPPYGGQGFRCDVCGEPGRNHWFYSCAECGFDVHLDCPTAKAPAEPQFKSTTRAVLNVGQAGFHPDGPGTSPNGFQNGTAGTARVGVYGPNQLVLLTPNRVPMTTFLQPNGSVSVGPAAASQGGMSGMGGLIAGSVVTGIGQQLVSGLANGCVNGSGGSSGDNSSEISDVMNCWVGGDFF